MSRAGDCPDLQGDFDLLDEENQATTSRTGHTNVALMLYIHVAMGSAGCYT